MDFAFVLHSVPYKETSLIVELFCRDFGRVPVIAKGAKRPHSSLRSVLVSFQPLAVRFGGKSEVKTLTHAEWSGGVMSPQGKSLFAAYYLNELLMRGLEREDPHVDLFDLYAQSLADLWHELDMSLVVRRFEIGLLEHLGYGLDCVQDVQGQAIRTDFDYEWIEQSGWQATAFKNDSGVPGELILALGLGQMNRAIATALRHVTRQLLLKHIAPGGVVSRLWMEHLFKYD